MKVRQAFERAMSLINERDSAGEFHKDIADFESNTPELVNTLVTLLWLDECIIRNMAVREISWEFKPVSSLDDEIPLHEALASAVLPYALASFLILEEDSRRADYFYSLYKNARDKVVAAFATANRGHVKDVY